MGAFNLSFCREVFLAKSDDFSEFSFFCRNAGAQIALHLPQGINKQKIAESAAEDRRRNHDITLLARRQPCKQARDNVEIKADWQREALFERDAHIMECDRKTHTVCYLSLAAFWSPSLMYRPNDTFFPP